MIALPPRSTRPAPFFPHPTLVRAVRDLIIGPAAALGRCGPRRILFVRRGSPDDGAPGRGEGPIEPVDGGERPRTRSGEDSDQAWKLVGTGAVEEGDGTDRKSTRLNSSH